MFRKVASLEISRNSVLTRVAGLQPTGCNVTKKKCLTELLNVYEKLCNGVSL